MSNIPNESEIKEGWQICWDMGRANTSLLQRRMKINYEKAYRIIDHLENIGAVGVFNSRRPRKVLLDPAKSKSGDK